MPADLPPAIGAHRLLGDGRSSALVTPDATIDWWCAPALDSPPLLWSLLDPGGGKAWWPGTRRVDGEGRPAGSTTRTTLSLGRTRIEVRDALLPVAEGGSALVRLVRSLDGPLEVTHQISLGGFDGQAVAWSGPHEVVGGVGGDVAGVAVFVTGGRTTVGDDGTVTTWLDLDDRWSATVVSCAQPVAADVGVLAEALVDAERSLAASLQRVRLPGHHPERASDALVVLEACTFRETGAVVAAPTTSLPEAPGADRQFDYRYTWLRDASLAVSVASLLGHSAAAERYLSFVHRVAGDGVVPKQPMSDIRGGAVPEEREVGGVNGWAGSRPVRVGNAAADQVQLDALGLLAEAISVYLQTGGSLDDQTWELVAKVADDVAADDDAVSNGIWELRQPRALVSADIGRWLALDRALWIARGWRPFANPRARRRWKRARDAARARVIDAIASDGSLPQAYGEEHPVLDASGLMAVLFGLLDRSDPRSAALVDTTIAGLGAEPYLYRYEPGGDDGFDGREGAFIPMSWWAAGALAQIGRLREAHARVDALCAALPRLLAEEVDPGSGSSLGNVPLVWSHIEAARTMYLLDAETRRARYGTAGLWVWRLGRYVALRRSRRQNGDDVPELPVLEPADRRP